MRMDLENRPAYYWQSRGGSKDPRDQALSPAQQDFDSTASGTPTAAYDVGSAQPLTTTGSGDSATNVSGFLRQYTISSDQNVQQTTLPQSQGGYTAQSSGTSGSITWLLLGGRNQAAPGFQSQLLSSPVSLTQGSSSQALPSQQSSLQLASPGLVVYSPSQRFTASYVPGTQAQSSNFAISSLGVASSPTATSQQARYGSQSAANTLYGYSQSQGQGAQASFQSQPSPYKSTSLSQGSSSSSLPSQQSSLLLASPSQGISSLTANYVPGTQAQPSSSGTSSLSAASDLATSFSYGSQSAARTVYAQPSSWYSSSQGQSAQTSSQSQTSPNKPVSLSQDLASQPLASQQGNLQLASPSLTTSYVSGTQTQPSSQETSSLSSTSPFATTPQQASHGFQSVGVYGQPSSFYSSTQSQSVQVPSQSADAPYKPVVNMVDAYTAGPAKWYMVGPFGQTGQANKPLFPSQASGSQAIQQSPSYYPSTSQRNPGSSGSSFQSQNAPASPATLTQSASQLSSFQTPTGLSTTSFSPSGSASQPIQRGQSSVSWQSSGVPSSLDQNAFGQASSVANGQQVGQAFPSTGFSSTLPSQSTSQTSENYGQAFQSSATQVGSFDQYSTVSGAASGASTSPQSTPVNSYSNQAFGAFGQLQPAVGSSVYQQTSEVQDGSSVSGSTRYSFAQILNNPILKPATRRGQDQF